jgi:hypothetical protein
MPLVDQQLSALFDEKVISIDASEGKRILAEVRSLRRTIIDAWHERGVVLSREEQDELRDEIRQTCELLTSLTSSS